MMERNTRQTTDCTDYSIIYLCMLFPSDTLQELCKRQLCSSTGLVLFFHMNAAHLEPTAACEWDILAHPAPCKVSKLRVGTWQ